MAILTTKFTAHQTDIPGLLICDVSHVDDDRGYFQEIYQKNKLVAVGMPKTFDVVQTNLSYNQQTGVARGFHAEPWDKYISIITGKVFAAYVDLREGPTFGKIVTADITPNTAVFLPRGVGNAYQTLEPNCYYYYSVNGNWSADNYDKYCFVNLADPDLNIKWPIPLSRSIMSERDRNHPKLHDIIPMEAQ